MPIIYSNLNSRIESNQLLKDLHIRKNQMKEMKKTSCFDFIREATTTEYQPTGRSLGTGSFAIAIEVVHITTGKKYVAKIITADKIRGYEKGIMKEIQVMQYYSKTLSKSNTNILRLVDCFRIVENNQTHICMIIDLCDTNDLFDSICDMGAYSESQAKKVIYSVLDAIKFIHQCGIVHRDIKAENILLKNGKPILADFGLAEFCDINNQKSLTEYCGTPGTTAPEILRNEPYGTKCDMYSLGALAYFLLAGYRPFDWTRDPREERDAVLANKYGYPEESFGGVSDLAKDFINQCMNLDPEKRLSAEEAMKHPWFSQN